MYAVEAVSTISQGNAKSCIQALLKTRENHPVSVKPCYKRSNKDSSLSNLCSSYTDQEVNSQNLELSKIQTSSDYIYEATAPDSLEHQKDFNYSQKLFHIADGNLYSIFSPIQGRSYGMKPSFLRKQKYTVQECHSRGRKNLRKGLKFHNFLPSESVTSEKDNGYLRSKWKVHSECRLREEHGTKQITISNWSQSVQNPSNEVSDGNVKNVLKCDSSATAPTTENHANQSTSFKCNESDKIILKSKSDDDFDPYDFNLSLQSNSSPENSNCSSAISKDCKNAEKSFSVSGLVSLKKDSLSCVLNSLIDKPISENKVINNDEKISSKSPCQNPKHRRKPVQTRRIVPYMKYLSIMEENESLPLDLSSKCGNSQNLSIISEELQNISGENIFNCGNVSSVNNMTLKTVSDPVSNSNTSLLVSSVSNNVTNAAVENALQTQITTPLTFICPLPVNEKIAMMRHTWPQSDSKEHQDSSNDRYKSNSNQLKSSIAVSVESSLNALNQSLTNSMHYSLHKPLVKETQSKTRRRNQRSVIKQKLEDTFRQNGFLVKTKQVSDGEATFCKFRQLRKYTRYYLKSWQQHLPDEVNKMWKGFLPPKTVLPPVSGTTESNGALL